MPSKTKKPCRFPGCPKLIAGDITPPYCEAHKKAVSKNYEMTRETATQRGYNTRHQKWRKMVLARHPICGSCHREPSTRAHHIDKNPRNTSLENGMGLCESCHNKLHAKEGDRF